MDRIYATFRTLLTSICRSSALLLIVVCSLMISNFDFVNGFAKTILCLILFELISFIGLPVLLSISSLKSQIYSSTNEDDTVRQIPVNETKKVQSKRQKSVKYKVKGNSKLQPATSLSTISEESIFESELHDLSLDLSIKCYKH